MLQRLELLGRLQLDGTGSGIDASTVYPSCLAPFWEDSQADPKGFLADLRAVVATDTGGFATYGASCLVWEFFSAKIREEDALALFDGGIAFKRERGLPSAFLTGYEWTRWLENHRGDEW